MVKRPAILIVGLIVLYVGVAMGFLVAMPEPRGPFEYLVAGAFATGICLMIGFGIYAKARFDRSRAAQAEQMNSQDQGSS